jgi:hypothetical protein
VPGQTVRIDFYLFGQRTSRKSFLTGFDKKAERVKSRLLS